MHTLKSWMLMTLVWVSIKSDNCYVNNTPDFQQVQLQDNQQRTSWRASVWLRSCRCWLMRFDSFREICRHLWLRPDYNSRPHQNFFRTSESFDVRRRNPTDSFLTGMPPRNETFVSFVLSSLYVASTCITITFHSSPLRIRIHLCWCLVLICNHNTFLSFSLTDDTTSVSSVSQKFSTTSQWWRILCTSF